MLEAEPSELGVSVRRRDHVNDVGFHALEKCGRIGEGLDGVAEALSDFVRRQFRVGYGDQSHTAVPAYGRSMLKGHLAAPEDCYP
jgi:hypothetical protein